MGNYEIRTLLGVSRQRAYQITQLESFPAPVAELASGGIWLAADVEDWVRVHRPDLRQASTDPSEVVAGALGERQDQEGRRESDDQP
jgi:prophage regulatory protein